MTNNTFISINPASMTKFIKKSEITSKWYEIDANNAVVGRLATVVSKILRGKNKATYTPHMDTGDFVIVKNIEKIKFTRSNFQKKKNYKNKYYPGRIKETNPVKMKEKNKSDEIIKLAIKRMIPKGPLGKQQLSNCRIYRSRLAGLSKFRRSY